MSKSKVMPWLRLYTEIIDDWKIRSLAFEDRWHYVAILCLKRAGELDKGVIDLRMMSVKLGVHGQDLEGIQNRLIDAGLIDENWQPLAWDERQRSSDRDETNAERQKRYREKSKKENLTKSEACNTVTDSNALRNAKVTLHNGEVTPLDTDIDTDTDTDEDKDRSANALKSAKPDSCPHQKIIEIYHETLPELTRVMEWTDLRKKLLKSRWLEKPERQQLDWWRGYFEEVRLSEFLLGRTDEPFKCSLEWLIRPKNFPKVLEGTYRTRSAQSKPYSTVTGKNIKAMHEVINARRGRN